MILSYKTLIICAVLLLIPVSTAFALTPLDGGTIIFKNGIRTIITDDNSNVTAKNSSGTVIFRGNDGITVLADYVNDIIDFFLQPADGGINVFIPETVEDLTNVTDDGCTVNQVRVVNGTGWYVCGDLSAGGGEANTASNVGSGVGVFRSKVGVDLTFHSLLAGSGMSITDIGDEIRLNATASGGGNVTNLDDAGDTVITSPLDNDFLRYNGVQWINEAVSFLSAAITSINGDTTAAQTIAVESGNLTMTNAGATHTVGFGINPVITGGSAQTITKGLTTNALTFGGNVAGGNFLVTGYGTPTAASDVQRTDQIGLNKVTIGPPSNDGQYLRWQASNSTIVWATPNGGNATIFTELGDVDAPDPIIGQIPFYNGTYWNATRLDIHDLKNVTRGGCAVGQSLQVNSSGIFACVTGGGGGEVNTASNSGNSGYGPFLRKTGVDLELANFTGTSGNVTVSLDSTNDEIDLNLGVNVVMINGQRQNITKGIDITGLGLSYEFKNTDYTATSTDDILLVDATGGRITITLPTASSSAGKILVIKSVERPNTNVVTVDGNGADTIDGFANFNLTMTDDVAIIISNGTEWKWLNDENTAPLTAGTTKNRWHGSAINAIASSTRLSVPITLRASPMIVDSGMVIDQIGVEVSTAASPTTNLCRIGIYRDDGNVYPNTLVAGSDVATFDGTAGLKTNTFASPIKLTRGLYWMAYACQDAATTEPTFRAVATAALPVVIGWDHSQTGADQQGSGYTVAFTFAALPNSYPAGGTVLETLSQPNIVVRIIG